MPTPEELLTVVINASLAPVLSRLAVLEGKPPPSAPPPAGGATGTRLTRNGMQLLLGGKPWEFRAGFNDPGLIGHDGDSEPTTGLLAEFLSSFKPGTPIRYWALPGWSLETIVRIKDAIVKAGHVPIITLGDGAENPGTPENYGPEFYGGGFRTRFLPHVRTICSALGRDFGGIIETMNETAHLGNGASFAQVKTFEHEVAAAVKAILPDTLVMSGVQDTYHGFADTPDEYRQLLDHPAIDISTLHDFDLYSVGRTGVHGRFNINNNNFGVSKTLGKPMIIGEMGCGSKGSMTDQQRADALRTKLHAYRAAGAAAVCYWRLSRFRPVGTLTNGDSARDSWSSPAANVIRTFA
jgi:hypothetical protein